MSTDGSPAKEAAGAADGGLREVGIVSLQRESLADGLARLPPRGIDIVIGALGGPFTGQAVGALARGGRLVVMGYSAGTETSMRVTTSCGSWPMSAGSRCSPPRPASRQRHTQRSCR